MQPELRKIGIAAVGDMPWGCHFCCFYETKQDLLDTLVPYFKAGLESNEYCIWAISNSDFLSVEEARRSLQKAVPDFDHYLSEKSIEIINGTDWYLTNGNFNSERVTTAWDTKLEEALARGYQGLRGSGDTTWLSEKHWKQFCEYEKHINESTANRRVIFLCTYPLKSSKADDVLDVVQTHQFAIARRQGKWEISQSSVPVQAKEEIRRLNEALQRFTKREREASAFVSYGLVVVSVSLAILTGRAMESWLQSSAPVSLLLCAVMFSAWFGGIRSGLLSVVLSFLAYEFFFVPPINSFDIEPNQFPRLFLFLLSAFFVGALSVAQRNRAESLKQARDALDHTVQELQRSNIALQAENSERKRTERALRESEERFRQMAETIREVFWMSSADLNRTLYVSPAYESVWDQSCESLYREPTSFANSIHCEDRPRVIEAINKDREHGFEVEYRLVRPDKSIRWIRDRGFPIKDEGGRFYRMVGIAEDITDHKLAEEKLKRSESLLAEAQRLAHVGSFEWNLQTNAVTWSDELYRIFGLEPGTIQITGDAMSFLHPDDREVVWNIVKESVAAKRDYSFYYRIRRPNGEERILHTRGFILRHENGHAFRVFGATQDVTELKRSEETLKATYEQMRALSASIQAAREQESTRIAREIHDELGASLTSLRWGLEEVGDSLSEAKDPRQLSALRENIEGMLALTDGLMNKVRWIASELRPVGLDELGLVEAIEWQARQFETRSGISVICEFKLEKVDLNTEQSTAAFRILQEAMTNILRHAQATEVVISLSQTSQGIVLTIQDNGRGITEQEKLDSQSLGLLGMKERAHLVGGELEITGIEAKGTLVSLRIPISVPESSLLHS